MNKKNFDQEIAMCRKLYKKSKGYNWGKCADCGVVLLLHKLYKGEVIDNKKEVKKLKSKVLDE